MIVVDSSVWINYFNNIKSKETSYLHQCLGFAPVATGDLILAEVLRGFKTDKGYLKAKELLSHLFYYDLVGKKVADESIKIFREFRRKGITINKPNDLFIAAFCILNKFELLHCDKDFDLIQKNFDLRVIKI